MPTRRTATATTWSSHSLYFRLGNAAEEDRERPRFRGAAPRAASQGLCDASVVFAGFVLVQGAALLMYRATAHPSAATLAAVIVRPYAAILTLVLCLRRRGRPRFVLSSFTQTVRAGWWWIGIAAGTLRRQPTCKGSSARTLGIPLAAGYCRYARAGL